MNTGANGFGERRYRTNLRPFSGWPELTALADILFLALLFFILASASVQVSGVGVSLPKVNVQHTAVLARYVVSLTPAAPEIGLGGNIYFRDRLMSADELRKELSVLHDHDRNATVIIRADRNVPFERVAEVMSIVGAAKLSSFIAVTRPEEKPSAPIEI